MDPDTEDGQITEVDSLMSVLKPNKLIKHGNWLNPKTNRRGYIDVELDDIESGPINVKGFFKRMMSDFSFDVQHLPMIRCYFEMTSTYPHKSTLQFKADAVWMTKEQSDTLQAAITKVIGENKGKMQLHLCYQQVIDTVTEMKISAIDLDHAKQANVVPASTLLELVMTSCGKTATDVFKEPAAKCSICLDFVYHTHCHRCTGCNHYACKTCLENYYKGLASRWIAEPFCCFKYECDAELPIATIKEVLGDQLFEKYNEELVETALREMGPTMRCARETCKRIAFIIDTHKNLGNCSYCEYSFCIRCNKAHHGDSACVIEKGELHDVIEQYKSGNPETRAEIYATHGQKKVFQDFLCSQWKCANSKKCPKCSTDIEKIEGCNRMKCAQCATEFCWSCGEKITNGYMHYGMRQGICRLTDAQMDWVDDPQPWDDEDGLPEQAGWEILNEQ